MGRKWSRLAETRVQRVGNIGISPVRDHLGGVNGLARTPVNLYSGKFFTKRAPILPSGVSSVEIGARLCPRFVRGWMAPTCVIGRADGEMGSFGRARQENEQIWPTKCKKCRRLHVNELLMRAIRASDGLFGRYESVLSQVAILPYGECRLRGLSRRVNGDIFYKSIADFAQFGLCGDGNRCGRCCSLRDGAPVACAGQHAGLFRVCRVGKSLRLRLANGVAHDGL